MFPFFHPSAGSSSMERNETNLYSTTPSTLSRIFALLSTSFHLLSC